MGGRKSDEPSNGAKRAQAQSEQGPHVQVAAREPEHAGEGEKEGEEGRCHRFDETAVRARDEYRRDDIVHHR